MKLKNAALLLMIGALIEIIADIYHNVYFLIEYKAYVQSMLQWVQIVLNLLATIGIGLVALSVYRKPDLSGVRPPALFLAIVAGVSTLVDIYSLVESLIVSWDWFSRHSSLIFSFLLMQMVPIALGIFALSLGSRINLRRASWWLIYAGLVWTFWLFFNRLGVFIVQEFDRMGTGLVIHELLRHCVLLYPIALVIFGFSLPEATAVQPIDELSDNNSLLDATVVPEQPVNEEPAQTVSVKKWLSWFLLAAIPLVGTFFLIVWGVDRKNRVRGNWAIACFIFLTLAVGLYSFVLGRDLAYLLRMENLHLMLALLFIVLLITLIFLAAYGSSERAEETSTVGLPSIGTWAGYLFVAGIPLVGLILLIVWSNEKDNRIRRTWAIAQLVWMLVMLVYYYYGYAAIKAIGEYAAGNSFLNF